jgi:ethanolamine utilization protein EutQ (cupin superfamily)
MRKFKVDFESMPWDEGRDGVRLKDYCEDGRRLRLVDFQTSEGFDGWCELGHIGYVLEGGLEIDFKGKVLTFAKGDGLFVPAGNAGAHRAVSIVPGTRLLMVEDA